MSTFALEMVTRDEHFPSRQVTSLQVPGREGRLTVLTGHQPMVCELTAGRMEIVDDQGKRETWDVGEGYLTVERDGVTILAASVRSVEE